MRSDVLFCAKMCARVAYRFVKSARFSFVRICFGEKIQNARDSSHLKLCSSAHAHAHIVKEVHAPPSDVVCDRFEVFVAPFVGVLRVFFFFERSRCFREIEHQTRRGDDDDDDEKKKLRFENERDYEQ